MKAIQKGCRLFLFAALLAVPCAGFASCTAPPSGIVGWWRGEGNPSDSIGTNNGVWNGTAAYAPAEVGQGFAFSGQNNVTMVDSPVLHALSSAITIEAWFKVNSFNINANSGWAALIAKGNASWRLDIQTTSGQIVFSTTG